MVDRPRGERARGRGHRSADPFRPGPHAWRSRPGPEPAGLPWDRGHDVCGVADRSRPTTACRHGRCTTAGTGRCRRTSGSAGPIPLTSPQRAAVVRTQPWHFPTPLPRMGTRPNRGHGRRPSPSTPRGTPFTGSVGRHRRRDRGAPRCPGATDPPLTGASSPVPRSHSGEVPVRRPEGTGAFDVHRTAAAWLGPAACPVG